MQERLLARLQAENYLSATRFAEAYTRGKLRNNRWGQRKIAMGLAAKGVDKALIADQLHALPPDDVRATLRTLLERRDASKYHALPALERRQKLYRLGLSRGFDADMVGEEVKRVMGN
jgi:regulatory protein